MKLKLFVWKDVLCQWTCGVVFALAENEEQARQLAIDSCEEWEKASLIYATSETPLVYDTPGGFYVLGGA